ncbi:MAG: chemotaxis protein CheX [Clostridiales bacterium]|jgi:CheY-specific phosphatase CheX|nr:chemotaxis protein CheX [Eubacteriales bacterium]MDH7565049.1 chemotaxis protein CheX [Clostridiales bacterium]
MEYINIFNNSIREAFQGMFDKTITLESETSAPGWILSKGVAVIIGITGEKKGRVLLDMPFHTAMELAARLDPDLNDEDFALFTAAEFCNVASGGAITAINNKFGGIGLRLATPSIFTGTNSKIFSPNLKAVRMSYNTRFGEIDFHIALEGV